MNSLIIISCAVCLILGVAIVFLKLASFFAEHAEGITKLLLGVAILVLICASVAQYKPNLVPEMTKVCNLMATAISNFAKPLIG